AEPALALAPLPLQETLRPLQTAPAEGPQASGPSPAPSSAATPLQAFVAEKGLRLSGVILGPVSVVILSSKEGYQVLPVGSTWPGSEVLIRSATSESVELALKDETLTLSLSKEEGGGR
ncbi:MAG: competence protein, partial [Thermoleophilia bacterium]